METLEDKLTTIYNSIKALVTIPCFLVGITTGILVGDYLSNDPELALIGGLVSGSLTYAITKYGFSFAAIVYAYGKLDKEIYFSNSSKNLSKSSLSITEPQARR